METGVRKVLRPVSGGRAVVCLFCENLTKSHTILRDESPHVVVVPFEKNALLFYCCDRKCFFFFFLAEEEKPCLTREPISRQLRPREERKREKKKEEGIFCL